MSAQKTTEKSHTINIDLLRSPHSLMRKSAEKDQSSKDDSSMDRYQLLKQFDMEHASPTLYPPMASKKPKGDGSSKAACLRGSNFSEEEILIVTKSVMKNSVDKIRGTNKKAGVMWKEVWKVYTILINHHNTIYGMKNPAGFAPFVQRIKASIKKQWSGLIRPAVNTFSAICGTRPPKSG